MAPPAFLAACLERARETGRPVVGTRPVTDTVKVVAGGVVGATLDRDGLLAITSPLVLPAAVLASLAQRPSTDLARAVGDLAAAGHRVETLEAPPEARRVATDEDVRLLEALTHPIR
jgi:2-C-methyl-D-erythritol 4-phosphate cytidylyltransferase